MNQPHTVFEETYDELKLSLLKIFAKQWVKAHPCIHRIALYLAGPENDGANIKYILAANAPEYSDKKLPKDDSEWRDEDKKNWQIVKYHNWVQGFDLHCQGEIERIHKKQPDEKNIPENHINKWMWYPIGIDENIEDYNLNPDGDFVLVDTEYILYEANDTKNNAPHLSIDIGSGEAKKSTDTKYDTPQDELEQFLKLILLEINLWYKKLVKFMKPHGGMLHTTEAKAIKSFEPIEYKWEYLIKNDLKGDFYGSSQYTRDIKSGITRNIIERQKPHLPTKCPFLYNSTELYNRYIKKQKLPTK